MTETRTKVHRASDLVPLKRLQADTISMKGVPSGGYQGIINVVDLFSHYSWQVPVQTVGNAGSAAAAVNALLEKIKARYSLKPPLVLQTDNGPEFKIQFERALDKEVKVTHGPAYTSNAQGEVENANKIWRGVMRRLLHSRGAEPREWSKFVPQANEIMNSRPISTLNHKTAAEVLHGVLGGDDELLQSTRQAILGRANAKRTPSNVTAYKIGDRVPWIWTQCHSGVAPPVALPLKPPFCGLKPPQPRCP